LNDTGREGPTVNYEIPVPNGIYNIVLHSASQSSIIQTVNINGTQTSWTVTAGLTTVERLQSFSNFNITTGNLSLTLTRTGGTSTNARITGIEIVSVPQAGPPSVAFTALRVRRLAHQLIFSRRLNDTWIDVQTQSLPAGATAHRGGVFVATGIPQSVRMSFDYLLLADPGSTSSLLTNLRLTEIMYNPSAGGVEFIELQNTGVQPISLQGVQLDEGSPFAAFSFANESLAPGECFVLTENVAAFQAVYGTAARVASWTAGNLNNGGERVVVRDPLGNAIHDFSYNDVMPWPLSPDGEGPSLEVIDVNGDYGDGLNWRASFEPFGSPGFVGVGLDSDGDGVPDAVEALFGTDPADGNSRAVATATTNASGHITLAWPTVAGRRYRIDRCTDLVNWAALDTVTATGSITPFTDPGASTNMRFYYRVVALP
jgi:hypothetical protein